MAEMKHTYNGCKFTVIIVGMFLHLMYTRCQHYKDIEGGFSCSETTLSDS